MEMKTTRYPTPDARYSASDSRYATRIGNPKSRIYSYILIFCLTFVPLNLLVSLTSIVSANTATEIQQPLPKNSLTIFQDSNSPRIHELLRAQISAIDSKEDQQSKESKDRLKQTIEQVRSFRFGPEPQQAAPSAAPAKTVVTEPGQSASDLQVGHEDPNKKIESESPREQITGETLQMLKGLTQHPEKLSSPLELGEVLFSSGHLTDAALFYREALKRIDPNDANASGDRAWILFQIGNCLRNSDRSAASKMYGQLLTEYPQSPWAEMAKAEGKLIDWYVKDNPHTLMDADKQKTPTDK
jgi:tetratricopeptide (TPR) repeat protein